MSWWKITLTIGTFDGATVFLSANLWEHITDTIDAKCPEGLKAKQIWLLLYGVAWEARGGTDLCNRWGRAEWLHYDTGKRLDSAQPWRQKAYEVIKLHAGQIARFIEVANIKQDAVWTRFQFTGYIVSQNWCTNAFLCVFLWEWFLRKK